MRIGLPDVIFVLMAFIAEESDVTGGYVCDGAGKSRTLLATV